MKIDPKDLLYNYIIVITLTNKIDIPKNITTDNKTEKHLYYFKWGISSFK